MERRPALRSWYREAVARIALRAGLAALVACNPSPDGRPLDARLATSATALVTADAGPQEPPRPRPGEPAIAAFVAVHGGRHAGPFRLPDGRWLFFVGGDVARGGWVASVAAATSETVFEAVDLPRAVRVLDVVVHGASAYVLVESVAALDQPAGLRGVVVVGKDEAPWTWADARSASELLLRIGEERPSVPLRGVDPKRFARAAKSTAALAAEIGAQGVDVYEIWQRVLVRKVDHLDRESVKTSPRRDALRGLLGRLGSEWATCEPERARCLVGHTGDMSNDEGAYLSRDGDARRLQALYLVQSPPKRADPEPPPSAGGGDTLVETWRFTHDARSAPRVLAQADVGGGHVFGVVGDGKDAWIVERDGAYSNVERVVSPREWDTDTSVGPSPGARIVDLDGDGVAEILVWDTTSRVPRLLVYRRTHTVANPLERDLFGAEVPALGAATFDEAERLARAPLQGVRPSDQQRCALVTKASTARGFRSLAAPGARVVVRRGSFAQGELRRVIPAADVKDEDLGFGCGRDWPVGCFEGRYAGLCDVGLDATQTTHPLLHFVRVGGEIKIDVISVFE
jgi:hypothetical protein